MAANTAAREAATPAPAHRRPTGFWPALWALTRETVATCFRYRVTGLAAEAGFFALLSLPPLVLGLVGTLGYFDGVVGEGTVATVRAEIIRLASQALTTQSVQDVIAPTLDDVLQNGRFDIVSVGFLLSLWSGSRAVNVYVDTITIMYGLSGTRGIIHQRALSFGLYIIGLVLGVIFVPLVLAGPALVDRLLPEGVGALNLAYWPLAVCGSIAFLAGLYHISVPVPTRVRRAVPGAVLALMLWVSLSFVLRSVIRASVGGPSIYGPLAAPIVVMIWLYALALSVLIGAALNAAADRIWPVRETQVAREESPPAVLPENRVPSVPIADYGEPADEVTSAVAASERRRAP